jgi:hypothetical protein
MIGSQIAFAPGACGKLARVLMPFAVNTVSRELVNWPARSLIKNLTEVARTPRPSGSYGLPVSSVRGRVRGDVGEVNAAGAVIDDDQDLVSRS